MSRDRVLRLAAPGAFLAALTVAVLLVRSGLHHGSTRTTSTRTTATASQPARTVTTRATSTLSGTVASPKRYYTVQSGDTYGSIATKSGTTVQQLQQLNPGTSSNSLSVGQKIRIK